MPPLPPVLVSTGASSKAAEEEDGDVMWFRSDSPRRTKLLRFTCRICDQVTVRQAVRWQALLLPPGEGLLRVLHRPVNPQAMESGTVFAQCGVRDCWPDVPSAIPPALAEAQGTTVSPWNSSSRAQLPLHTLAALRHQAQGRRPPTALPRAGGTRLPDQPAPRKGGRAGRMGPPAGDRWDRGAPGAAEEAARGRHPVVARGGSETGLDWCYRRYI